MDENNQNPSVISNQVDTSSWNIPSMVSTPVDLQQSPSMFTPEPVMPGSPDRSKEIESFLGTIRYDASDYMQNSGRKSWLNDIDPTGGKMDLYSEVGITDTHELLNDGESWLPKYKSYLPGVDNDSRLSAQQSGFEKFVNPLLRFGSNTSKGVLDIGSFVYGVGAAAMSGRFDALYDNSMSKYVDDLTNKTNFEYKNYYDAETREKGLGLDIQTWDKVLGGAEFTARMLASEALIAVATDGASLPSALARAGLKAGMAEARVLQAGRNISKMMSIATLPERTVAESGNIARMSGKFADALTRATNRGKWGERLVQARFAITSPMYEAGFEAMHMRKEAQKQFFDYYREKGTEPTPEEISAFANKSADASNWVFGANMGILSLSNLALFGDLLNIKNPLAKSVLSPSNFIKNNIFRQGTEKIAETGLNQAMKAGVLNKAAAYLAPVVKGMLIEGVYEEGSQGIASNTLKNYVASSYDPEAMKNTSDYMDAFTKSFGQQFTSKEGQEEIMIGALIGGLFGGVGGVRNASREYAKQETIADLQNVGEEFTQNFVSNAYTNEQLLSVFAHANRDQSFRKSIEEGESQDNKLKQASSKAQSFVSLLDAYHSVGKESEFTQMFSSALKGMDNQSIADMTGLDISEVDSFKQEQIQNMQDMADKYSTAREAGRYIFRPNIGGFTETEIGGQKVKVNSENLSSAFAFASTMSFFNEKFAFETYDAFQTKLAQLNANPELVEKLGSLSVLKNAQKIEQEKYSQLSQEENKLRLELGRVTKQVNLLSQGEEKTNSAQKRLDLSNEMISIQNRLSEASGKKDALWKSMTDNFYSKMNKTGYATQIDLQNFTQQVQDIQSSLDALNVSPEDKIILENLLNQFNEANNSYKDFTDLALKLSDPQLAFKTYRSVLGGIRAKSDKSLNEHTKDALMKVYGYNAELAEVMDRTKAENEVNPFTEEKLAEDYTITEEDLNTIKSKLNSKRTLSPNEQKFYQKYKKEINDYKTEAELNPALDTSDKTLINSLTIRKNVIQKQLDNLDQGVYSEELQKKIDRIDAQIKSLEDEYDQIEDGNIYANNSKTLLDKLNNFWKNVYFSDRSSQWADLGFGMFPSGQKLIPENLYNKYFGHGMGKSGTSSMMSDFIELFTTGIDPTRGNISGLYTAPMEGAGQAGGAIGATNPYSTGAFMLVSSNPLISNIDQVDAVLINDGLIEEYPEILELLQEFLPNMKFGRFSEAGTVIQSIENGNTNPEIESLDSEIQQLEKEILDLEESKSAFEERKKRTVESAKSSYQQYEYVKPNGDVITGYLEVNKGILQLVNETEIVDIEETTLPLRNVKTSGIKGLTQIKEEDVLIEGKEIYVNGKIYKLGLKNPTLDQSISKDKDGNYQVTLQAGNGRMVTLTGSTADAIVYQNLLNKLEENGTNEQIERIRQQAERDSEIERKYEELVSKTEDRDSRVAEIEQEQYRIESQNKERKRQIVGSINESKSEKIQTVEEERLNLQDQLAETNGEISREDKIQRLQDDIQDIRMYLIENETQEGDPAVQRLLFLEKELENLQKEKFKEPFNPEASPSEQLEWVINNIPDLAFSTIDELSAIQKPSQEDIDEYVELTQKKNKNSVQKKRISELRDKLLPYNLAEGLDLDGMNILDIVDLYNQSRNIQEIQETQENQLDEETFKQVNKAVKNTTDRNEYRSPKVGLVYDGAYIERQSGIDKIFHIKLGTFLSKALDKGLNPQIVVLNKNGRSNETPEEIIPVTLGNIQELSQRFDGLDNIKVDLDPENGLYLKKPKGEKSFHVYGGGILELIDSQAYRITGQSTGYIQIFEEKSDGTLEPKQSEFSVTRDGVTIPFDKETLNSLKPGDTVDVEFDPKDDYNKTLTPKEYVKKARIYVRKNGKLVQILKGTDVEGKTESEGWDKLEALRRKAVKSGVKVSVKIQQSYLGLPLISFDSPTTINETKIDESKVVAYGYIDENGELKGDISKVKADNSQYIEALKEFKKITPVVAFNAYGKTILFPLNLKPRGVNLTQDIDNVMNNQDLSREQKMFQINSILEQNQMFTEELALNPSNFNIENVKNALTNVYSKIDVTDSEQFKNSDKYSYINLNDPFMSAKLVFDLEDSNNQVIESSKATQEQFKKTVKTVNQKGLDESENNKCKKGGL